MSQGNVTMMYSLKSGLGRGTSFMDKSHGQIPCPVFLPTPWLTLVSCKASSALPGSPGTEALGCCNSDGHRDDLRVSWTCGMGILAFVIV